nr:PH domain-containing protein [Salsipaludibacter albus]
MERPVTWAVPVVVGLVFLGLTAVGPTLAWRRWRWDVDELALTLRHGVVTRQVQALPFFRIQHVDTHQGPLDRALGMTGLNVHTASITSRLPGIATAEAEDLRQELLERAAAAAREANTDGDVDAV